MQMPPEMAQWFASTPGSTDPADSELMAAASSLPQAENSEPAKPKTEEVGSERLTPERLVRWREGIERAIAQTLRQASHAANSLSQQAGILPKELPEVLLEAASK